MVKRNIISKKLTHIKHNLERLREKQNLSEKEFLANDDAKESVLLNLQHAIQGCLHIASHIISDEGWGVPGSQSEIFYILEDHKILTTELVESLVPMVGFRNLIVHQYEDVDFKTVYRLYQDRLGDLEHFVAAVETHFPP